MNLGNNLFQARKKAGLSQESVAEKLGVSRQIFLNGKLMKLFQIFINQKKWLSYIT